MENFSKNKMNMDTSVNEITIKKELNSEKEMNHLNLRKIKLNDLISSKRKINSLKKDNNEMKEKYNLNLEDIKNIPQEYIIDIPKFIEKVRKLI